MTLVLVCFRRGGVETFGGRWGEIVFRDHGRGFYLFIVVGCALSDAV